MRPHDHAGPVENGASPLSSVSDSMKHMPPRRVEPCGRPAAAAACAPPLAHRPAAAPRATPRRPTPPERAIFAAVASTPLASGSSIHPPGATHFQPHSSSCGAVGTARRSRRTVAAPIHWLLPPPGLHHEAHPAGVSHVRASKAGMSLLRPPPPPPSLGEPYEASRTSRSAVAGRHGHTVPSIRTTDGTDTQTEKTGTFSGRLRASPCPHHPEAVAPPPPLGLLCGRHGPFAPACCAPLHPTGQPTPGGHRKPLKSPGKGGTGDPRPQNPTKAGR